MQKPELEAILNTAVKMLFRNQPNIFSYTSETGQTEWNLAHHLANEVHQYFNEFDCDLDVTKRNFDFRRPDIIIHRRGEHEHNLLVIETKFDGWKSEIKDDVRKIHADWFRNPLKYQFGAVIDIRSDFRHKLLVFENPSIRGVDI
jgi:hypothetical protein